MPYVHNSKKMWLTETVGDDGKNMSTQTTPFYNGRHKEKQPRFTIKFSNIKLKRPKNGLTNQGGASCSCLQS